MKLNKYFKYFIIPFLLIVVFSTGLLLKNANRLLKHELEKFFGKDFSVESIVLSCSGVDAKNVSLILPDKRAGFKSDLIRLKADPLGILRGNNNISSLSLESPYFLLELDKNGKLILPFPSKKETKGKPSQKSRVFVVSSFDINQGSLDYIDRKVSGTPPTIRLREIRLHVRNIGLPSENIMSDYDLTAALRGKSSAGTIKSKGQFNMATKDSSAKINIKNIDITELKHYYQKKGDVEITKGLLSIDADVVVASSQLKSSGKIIIKDLQFRSGSGSQFLGLPLIAVIKLLKDNNNEISLDFKMEGDLNNPKFSISDSIMQKLTISLAKMMGIPIEMIGKSVFRLGGDVLKNIFK